MVRQQTNPFFDEEFPFVQSEFVGHEEQVKVPAVGLRDVVHCEGRGVQTGLLEAGLCAGQMPGRGDEQAGSAGVAGLDDVVGKFGVFPGIFRVGFEDDVRFWHTPTFEQGEDQFRLAGAVLQEPAGTAAEEDFFDFARKIEFERVGQAVAALAEIVAVVAGFDVKIGVAAQYNTDVVRFGDLVGGDGFGFPDPEDLIADPAVGHEQQQRQGHYDGAATAARVLGEQCINHQRQQPHDGLDGEGEYFG